MAENLPGQMSEYDQWFSDFTQNYDWGDQGNPWEGDLFNPQYSEENPPDPTQQGLWLDQYRNLLFGDAERASEMDSMYRDLYTNQLGRLGEYVQGTPGRFESAIGNLESQLNALTDEMRGRRDAERDYVMGTDADPGMMQVFEGFREQLQEAGDDRIKGIKKAAKKEEKMYKQLGREWGQVAKTWDQYAKDVQSSTEDMIENLQSQFDTQTRAHQRKIDSHFAEVRDWQAKGEAHLKTWSTKIEDQNQIATSAAVSAVQRDAFTTKQQISFMDAPPEVKAQLSQQQDMRVMSATTTAVAAQDNAYRAQMMQLAGMGQEFYNASANQANQMAAIQTNFATSSFSFAQGIAGLATKVAQMGQAQTFAGMSKWADAKGQQIGMKGMALATEVNAMKQIFDTQWGLAQSDVQMGAQIQEMGLAAMQRDTALTQQIAGFAAAGLQQIEGLRTIGEQYLQQGMAMLSEFTAGFPTNVIAFADLLMADLSVNATLSELGWAMTEAQSYGQNAAGLPGYQPYGQDDATWGTASFTGSAGAGA